MNFSVVKLKLYSFFMYKKGDHWVYENVVYFFIVIYVWKHKVEQNTVDETCEGGHELIIEMRKI